MDCKNILQQGDEAKYGVLISHDGFSMETDEFEVELSWGLSGQKKTIKKDDMVFGVDGYCYFIFETDDMVGRITAKCTYWVPDTDCPDGLRTETDIQMLCFVVTVPNPKFACVPATDKCEHKVSYERSEASDVASKYEYLCSSQGDRFITNDTEYILVLKSINNNG